MTLEDVSRDMGMLSLQGPKSRLILEKLTKADLSDVAFPFSTCQSINVAGHQVLALRVSFVGEMGWELHIPSESCVAVYKALMEVGQPLGLVNGGYRQSDQMWRFFAKFWPFLGKNGDIFWLFFNIVLTYFGHF